MEFSKLLNIIEGDLALGRYSDQGLGAREALDISETIDLSVDQSNRGLFLF